jgi:hypothetical protein
MSVFEVGFEDISHFLFKKIEGYPLLADANWIIPLST